uniref:Elongation of very long chain fatty acids protein n=1 Tax=Ditylenchus dipsaci TaxID=166011 RepID=A0A915CUS4_9BILA
MGMVRMAPEMWWSINSNSLTYSICTASFAQGVTGFWTENFAMSKKKAAYFPALVPPCDCVGLHLACLQRPHSLWQMFIFMNYTVHAFMYSYYALRALRMRLPKYVAMFITVLQITQMVFGVAIVILQLLLPCYLKRNNNHGSLKQPAALTNGSLSSNGDLPAANEYKQKANRDMLFRLRMNLTMHQDLVN